MKTYKNLYSSLCSSSNLALAYQKARMRKTLKQYVMNFEGNLKQNLQELQNELEKGSYSPRPLSTFIVRDPKTRKISASDFRDRIVHHALCNITEPILSGDFIYDSFANQKGKGTHKAIERFEKFSRKNRGGYVLKADIRHYFDTVDHKILTGIIGAKIKDPQVMLLVQKILKNHRTTTSGKGMPKGNLTSQFWGNVYLNSLDQFVKHELRAKYYIRYVDDFVILGKSKEELLVWKTDIERFLLSELKLELHPEKTNIYPLSKGVTFLGFRIYEHHRLLKRSNIRRIFTRIPYLRSLSLSDGLIKLNGWLAYAQWANTFTLRHRVIMTFMFGKR